MYCEFSFLLLKREEGEGKKKEGGGYSLNPPHLQRARNKSIHQEHNEIKSYIKETGKKTKNRKTWFSVQTKYTTQVDIFFSF